MKRHGVIAFGGGAHLAAVCLVHVPEAIAPGAALALGDPTVFLLAFLIAIENPPEGFNANREARFRTPTPPPW